MTVVPSEIGQLVLLKKLYLAYNLLDETSLFLHRTISQLPPHKQQMLEKLHRSDDDLRGRKVLVVDDDVRNIFALGSVLERHGMSVVTAQTGREALAMLQATADIAMVIAENGFTTIRAQVFTMLFVAILMWLMELDRRGKRLWIVPWLAGQVAQRFDAIRRVIHRAQR